MTTEKTKPLRIKLPQQELEYYNQDRVEKTMQEINPGDLVVVRYRSLSDQKTAYEYIAFVRSLREGEISLSRVKRQINQRVPESTLDLKIEQIGYLMPMKPITDLQPGTRGNYFMRDLPALDDYNSGNAILIQDALGSMTEAAFIDSINQSALTISDINTRKKYSGINPTYTRITPHMLARENHAIAHLIGKNTP